MSNNYNSQIAKIGGLTTALASEISNNPELKQGEKFLLLQRIFCEIKPLEKHFKDLEKTFKEFAFENLQDKGDNQSETAEFEGAEILVKYSYPKPILNSEKLKEDLVSAFAEIGTEFNENDYLKESTPRKKVIIQSILDKLN